MDFDLFMYFGGWLKTKYLPTNGLALFVKVKVGISLVYAIFEG